MEFACGFRRPKLRPEHGWKAEPARHEPRRKHSLQRDGDNARLDRQRRGKAGDQRARRLDRRHGWRSRASYGAAGRRRRSGRYAGLAGGWCWPDAGPGGGQHGVPGRGGGAEGQGHSAGRPEGALGWPRHWPWRQWPPRCPRLPQGAVQTSQPRGAGASCRILATQEEKHRRRRRRCYG